ncbi:hypothetical protein LUZ63_006599 [Rhynchospora breviuscula]|uniref:At4g15545-like C-terminal domain-containing protein n=1 Tax=Rhynchospora breviuscula TaxID=2022672 RepID=A0A9Q0CQ36_9POAL|nr:hypothetical protein LUZ63_006599 [Rhynchospora breviuscula]
MAQRDGVDFHLPDEILAVIPTDPYDQLDVARKITSMAIASRVTRLEFDSARLRQQIADRDRTIEELHEKVARLDRLVQEYSVKLKGSLEENAKLVQERDMLSVTAKKLARNLAKLETFKKQLMQTLSEDNLNQLSEIAADDNSDNLVARIPTWRDTYQNMVSRNPSWEEESTSSQTLSDIASGSTATWGSTQNGNELSITKYNAPAVTFGSSQRGFSTTGSSPRTLSGTTSPRKSSLDVNAISASYSRSSQPVSAPVSPPKRRPFSERPRMDGKEFFRQARSRLSYEQFGAFLANIKDFNSRKQSREETLQKAEEIIGSENKDLFISFQNLINRDQS